MNVSVCLSANISLELHVQYLSKSVCMLHARLNVALSSSGGAVICCAATSGFMDNVTFAHTGSEYATPKECILKVTQQGQHGFDTAAHTQTDPLGGSTGPGAESDINGCLV